MVQSICTFKVDLEGHSKRFFTYLLTDLGGQIKVLNVARSALDVAELVYLDEETTRQKIHNANRILGDIKIGCHFFKAPSKVLPTCRKCGKVKKKISLLYTKWQKGDQIEGKEILVVATEICGCVKKILSLLGDAVFKPLKLIVRYAEIEGGLKDVADKWEYISLGKSSAKVFYISGRLLLGSCEAFDKIVELIIELWELMLNILKLVDIKVHPAVDVTLSVSKSVFGIYEVYRKTE